MRGLPVRAPLRHPANNPDGPEPGVKVMLPENLIQVISSDAQEERQGAASPASVGEGARAAGGGAPPTRTVRAKPSYRPADGPRSGVLPGPARAALPSVMATVPA